MSKIVTISICGGGSLGHVIAGFLGSKEGVFVNMLTTKPLLWSKELKISIPEGGIRTGHLNIITNEPSVIIPDSDIVLLCLPGFAIKEELQIIKPYVSASTFVGSVFSSTGFFLEALELLPHNIPLWGFQRVPFISRTKVYGQSASLLGYKSEYNIAVEHTNKKKEFAGLIEFLFERPVNLLKNYYEASFTNSNPILHPARLYSMFKDWVPGIFYDHNILFYEEWTNEASELLIAMDDELFSILRKLPVSSNYLQPILKYYESYDAESLTRKITSIKGFKGITSPMLETKDGYIPDFNSRYFREDFPFGLRYIYQEACKLNLEVPVIKMIYSWGRNQCK